MVVIGALFGTAEAFFRPAYTGLVPQTVDEDEIQGAQALTGVSREIAEIAGPALATALVLGVGGAAAFALDAATFVVSALLLTRVRGRERGERRASAPASLRELVEGWEAVRAARLGLGDGAGVLGRAARRARAVLRARRRGRRRTLYGSDAVYGLVERGLGRRHGQRRASSARAGSRCARCAPRCSARSPWPRCIAVFALGPPLPVLYAAMAVSRRRHRAVRGLVGDGAGHSASRRTCCRGSRRGTGWARSPCCRSATCWPGPSAEALGAAEVMVVGGLVGTAVMALALLPGSTRDLARLEEPDRAVPEPPLAGERAPVGV